MRKGPNVTRRTLLGSSLLVGVADLIGCAPAEGAGGPKPFASPLAQDYVVAARPPNDGRYYYMHDPGMVLLPSGKILVAAPFWQLPAPTSPPGDPVSWGTQIMRSSDRGATWQLMTTLPFSDATPFVHDDGKVYMFVEEKYFQGLAITVSDDEGATWLQPATQLFPAAWNCSTGMVRQNGRLYWALSTGASFRTGAAVIAADASKNLLLPDTWRIDRGHASEHTFGGRAWTGLRKLRLVRQRLVA